jgi:hypothetical protein
LVLAPSRPDPAAEIVEHKINILIICQAARSRGDRSDLRITQLPAPTGFKPMAVESFQASCLRTKIMGGQGFPGPGSAAALDRLAQPLHGEFDVLRLQVAPALDLRLL